MVLLKGIFDLADDIVSIPTDLLGLTNHHDSLTKAKQMFIDGEITVEEYNKIKNLLK